MRFAARVAVLWAAFGAVHLLVAWLGWVYPSQPMGDVVLVYEPWANAVLTGGTVMGFTEPWVYPQLALIPMLLAKVLSLPLVAVLGASDAYLIAWAVLVTACDAVGMSVLVGRRGTERRRLAGWFWTAALLLLGPIAMYRIDAITVPIALVAGLWIARRPAVAAVLLVIGAWIKVWPGAIAIAAVVAVRRRIRFLLVALSAGVGIGVLLVLAGSDHLFGFLTAQTGRGLQVEAVAATPYLWLARAGHASIGYSFEILTFQVAGPGADAVAGILTPLMVLLAAGIVVLGGVRAVQGAAPTRLLPPLALSLIAALIVANKVGSPQFQVWLIVPMLLWLLVDLPRSRVPAVLVLALCALTCLIYPLSYDALLRAELVPVLLLTLRNALLIVVLVLGIRAASRSPRHR